MSKPDTRKAWVKAVEAETKGRQPTSLKAARAAWKGLSGEEQLAIAKEIVDTRASELCRAYRNVISLSCGFRTRRNKKTGKRRVVRHVCVTFLVKKKWKPGENAGSGEELPTHLFAYCTLRGKRRKGKESKPERRLCAVPTDVECASDYHMIRPQAETRGITVTKESHGLSETGAVACALERTSVGSRRLYAVSCRHVFAFSLQIHPTMRLGAGVRVSSTDKHVGKTRRHMGKLRNGPLPSFDAQMAEVDQGDREGLRQALNDLLYTDIAKNENDIPEAFWIQTPGGVSTKATNKGFRTNHIISYPIGGNRVLHVLHELLIESQVAKGATQNGDSGSPVTSTREGGILLGMHIAGGGDTAFMIPAWLLFEPRQYRGTGVLPDDKLKMTNP